MSVFEISELELSAELLPKREALGTFNFADLYASNTAVAISGEGDADASADQDIDLSQKG